MYLPNQTQEKIYTIYDKIKQVTNEMLDKFITTKNFLAVLFYKKENSKSEDALRVSFT